MTTPRNQDKQKARKMELRLLALRNRKQQPDREKISDTLCQKLLDLPDYHLANTVCSYVGVGTEVLTLNLIKNAMLQGKQVVVPYVYRGHLCLFHLCSLEELTPAPFGLLEPRSKLRNHRQTQIDPSDVGLYLVPGLAFGVNGERLGHGRGYYDDLLRRAPGQCQKVGLCFASQIVNDVPMFEHDVYMDLVVTEQRIYRPS